MPAGDGPGALPSAEPGPDSPAAKNPESGSFAEGMSAGRGFIAIAVVVLGRWHPLGVVAAALTFAAASALQYLFQAMGWTIPYQTFLALPYVLTLLGLAGIAGKATPPGSLGKWHSLN